MPTSALIGSFRVWNEREQKSRVSVTHAREEGGGRKPTRPAASTRHGGGAGLPPLPLQGRVVAGRAARRPSVVAGGGRLVGHGGGVLLGGQGLDERLAVHLRRGARPGGVRVLAVSSGAAPCAETAAGPVRGDNRVVHARRREARLRERTWAATRTHTHTRARTHARGRTTKGVKSL